LITPYLVGERIGLSPVTVIFALMAFGELMGFVGVLLALPLAAISVVLARYLVQRYFNSGFYQRKIDS
jgi:predicted PurR-regulated permease PerM